jgi:hypothetical protein
VENGRLLYFPAYSSLFSLFFLSFSLSPAAAMRAGERNGSVTEKQKKN